MFASCQRQRRIALPGSAGAEAQRLLSAHAMTYDHIRPWQRLMTANQHQRSRGKVPQDLAAGDVCLFGGTRSRKVRRAVEHVLPSAKVTMPPHGVPMTEPNDARRRTGTLKSDRRQPVTGGG